jgi:flagellar biogenesis protein FliO
MRITIILSFAAAFVLVTPISAQEPAQPQGIYDPDHPDADADGFVWKKETTDHRPQTTDQHSSIPALQHPTSEAGAETESALAESGAKNREPTDYLNSQYKTAQVKGEGPGIPTTSLGTIILQMIGGLGIVGGLFLLGAAGMKRIYGRGGLLSRGRIWQVVESVPLGPKRTLYVTKFVDRIYLIGATEQQISLLGEIQDPTLATAIESGDADFRRFLVPESLNENSIPEPREPAAEPKTYSRPEVAQEIPVPAPPPTLAATPRTSTRSFTV